MKWPSLIDQSSTSMCGIACIAHILALHDKTGYKNLVKDLYYYGIAYYGANKYLINPYKSIGANVWDKGKSDKSYPVSINENTETKKPMPLCDYILLTSIKSSSNLFVTNGNNNLVQDALSITPPKEIVNYLNNMLGMHDINDYTSLVLSGGDFNKLKEMDELYTSGYDLVMLISEEMLNEYSKQGFSFIPGHWVVYKGNLSFDKDGTASFKVFNWGKKDYKTIKIDKNKFHNNYYGYIKARW